MAKYIHALLVFLSFYSCSVEHVSKSPMNSAFAQVSVAPILTTVKAIPEELEINAELARLTNTAASITYVKNQGINKEIDLLKLNIQNFVYAYQAYNVQGQKRYMKQIQNSYKRIYISKTKMNEDEFLKLNHCLVKIKGSLAELSTTPIEIPN
ncbi:hypothetical protein [Bergeyella zoohelcum]|uniref:Uncharacterized protein n=1 Tax=Bergeyella zoohelcum TaxID=1015 RepID=A0A380ZW58_9FLAO|nr:hypothetical protein [Bergeyella zoohelcum]EKB60291.1 hypothetical protein HMPREF9700_01110 [Bergeyella zoohelcum CCUG 30536]SUV53028.1 Uncharacterised protein [Bergeyella zoohelcum]